MAKPVRDVELVTPHGARITVSAARAETLKSRPMIRFNDGSVRGYSEVSEDDDSSQNEESSTTTRRQSKSRGSN